MENHDFFDTNIVCSIVIYEWANELSIIDFKHIFDWISQLVGTAPDSIQLAESEAKYKSYKWKYFEKNNVINRREWDLIAYHWFRNIETKSGIRVYCVASTRSFRRLGIYIDEAAVVDVIGVMKQISRTIIEKVEPIYGYGAMQSYLDGPLEYARGINVTTYYSHENIFSQADVDTRERISAFGSEFRKNKRRLNEKLRDVEVINYISAGHLAGIVDGMTLEDWIISGNRGTLNKEGEATWVWRIPDEHERSQIRTDLIRSGLLVVTI